MFLIELTSMLGCFLLGMKRVLSSTNGLAGLRSTSYGVCPYKNFKSFVLVFNNFLSQMWRWTSRVHGTVIETSWKVIYIEDYAFFVRNNDHTKPFQACVVIRRLILNCGSTKIRAWILCSILAWSMLWCP